MSKIIKKNNTKGILFPEIAIPKETIIKKISVKSIEFLLLISEKNNGNKNSENIENL